MHTDASNDNFKTQFDVTVQLDTILDSIAILNKNIKYMKGFKVLAYSGSQPKGLQIRKMIMQAFAESDAFQDVKTAFVWHQPTYRVYVGECHKRLEAVRIAEFIKAYPFQNAEDEAPINPLVVPSNIQIRE